jgi:hypothetical protein
LDYGITIRENNLKMLLNKKDNTYNVDKTFDYFTVKSMVIESLEKIVREELNRRIANINLHKIGTPENKEHFCIMYPIIIIDYGSSMFG